MPKYFSLQCQHCSSDFQVVSRDLGRKYCAVECSNLAKRKHARAKNCLSCGTELAGKYQLKFCSNSCSASYNNKGIRRHGNPPSLCKVCNNQTPSHKHVYCSRACHSVGITIHFGAEKIKRGKLINRIAQHNWRARYSRKVDKSADAGLIAYIIKHCPEGWEVDHIIPLSNGGYHHEDNLQYLPAEENRRKGNRHIYSAVNREYSVREVVKKYKVCLVLPVGFEPT